MIHVPMLNIPRQKVFKLSLEILPPNRTNSKIINISPIIHHRAATKRSREVLVARNTLQCAYIMIQVCERPKV